MENLNLVKPEKVQNIINKFCYTIGMIPTSYKVSLTYEEQIIAIGHYLEETVIPALNNNAEAVAELQTLFVQLKDYVENYFDNLDVQNEINNKLDKMALDGTLQEIITSYLNVNGILAFNTVNDMKNATNIIDGSFVKTFGKNTLNDGLGRFYKIRKIKNTDVIDNVNIIPIITNNTLVAELINDDNKKYIFIGDSLGNGATGEQTVTTHVNGWCKVFANILKLNKSDYIIKAQDGAGFINGEYMNLLNSAINDINDKSSITDIIVGVGANEIINFNSDTLNNNLINFINTCKSNFVNAKITFGFMGYNKQNNDTIANYRYLWQTSIKSIINTHALLNNITFYDNLTSIWHWDDFVIEDGIHLNQNGYNMLGSLFVNDYKGGKSNGIENCTPQFLKSFTNPAGITRNNLNESIKTIINPTTATIILSDNLIEGNIPLTDNLYLIGSNIKMVGVNPTPKLFNIKIPVNYIANDGSNIIYTNGELLFNVDGNLYLKPFGANNAQNITALIINPCTLSIPIELC